jgi:zinc transport system substrate-binding protein
MDGEGLPGGKVMEGRESNPWFAVRRLKEGVRKVLLVLIVGLFLGVILTDCRKGPEREAAEKKLQVVTTLFPLYDFAKNVAKERADVSLLLPPGVEAHSFEPKPGDLLRINGADLFIYTGKIMEPWAESILQGVDTKKLVVVDASQGIATMEAAAQGEAEADHHHDHGRVDPHIWLDLSKAQMMVDTIVKGFVRRDPGGKDFFIRNGEEFKAKLAGLDRQFRESLPSCRKRVFIHGGHFAFNYLAKRYNLTYISAYKGSPDAEPTPKRIIELEKQIKKYNVKYVFYEELITPRVAEVIARETGAQLLKLHGAHNVSREEMEKGVTFLSIMENNLINLKKGLECP